ncbi:hypothetical protein ACJX0J_012764, partial [Zea mays]
LAMSNPRRFPAENMHTIKRPIYGQKTNLIATEGNLSAEKLISTKNFLTLNNNMLYLYVLHNAITINKASNEFFFESSIF